MWTDLFEHIFLINLLRRTDRLHDASRELWKYNIAFELVDAVEDDNGARGLFLTYKKILDRINPKRPVLFFEDDVLFLQDPERVMNACADQLLRNIEAWNVFYLGVNTHKPFSGRYAENILDIGDVDGRSTHAIAFSPHGIEILKNNLSDGEPVDMTIVRVLQRGEKKCFCSYPMLATQRGGYSDIDKKFDNMGYILERFNNHTRHLL